jgi:hypothetical protein
MSNTDSTRYSDPRFNQVKLFNRLYVMTGYRGKSESPRCEDRDTRRREMRLDWQQRRIPFYEMRQDAGKIGEVIHEPLSTIRHACRIGDVGPGIADEHISVRHHDRAQPLGVEGRFCRQQTVQVQNVGGDGIDVLVT